MKLIDEGNSKVANKLFRKAEIIFKKIKKTKEKDNLFDLLNHENDHVKYYVANELLEYEPELCKEAIRKVAKGNTMIALVAEYSYKMKWREKS